MAGREARWEPRLFYLGTYEAPSESWEPMAEVRRGGGDWNLHIERADIHPETVLRQEDLEENKR